MFSSSFRRWNRSLPQISDRADSPKRTIYLSGKTLVINLLGCFVIGLIAALAVKNSSLSPKTVLLIKTGLCGGFTTFSTFALETETLIKTGHIGLAIVYVALSVVVGVGLAFAGQVVVGK